MDCLRSFNFSLAVQSTFDNADGLYTWQIGSQNYFSLDYLSVGGSTYVIQGFKNINIFKIEVNGDWNNLPQIGVNSLVQNWKCDLIIKGKNSTPVGNVLSSPNDYGMIISSMPYLRLTKFQPSATFETPVESATEITLENLYCDGIAPQSLTDVRLSYRFNFTVFYQYEGE
jgi:hypothetical protein